MLDALLQPIVSWFRVDRIRVSPTTGRLVGLDVGDCFVFRNMLFGVTRKSVTLDGKIAYQLDLQGSQLFVIRDPLGWFSSAQLLHDGQLLRVFEDDIVLVKARQTESKSRNVGHKSQVR